MAYVPANLSLGFNLLGGKFRVWVYQSTDTFIGTVDGTDYFSNASAAGMHANDFLFSVDTDGTGVVMAYVSAIDADGNGTVTAVATSGAPTFTDLTVSGNALLGDAAADLIGFYGGTGASQRATSIQSSSAIAVSSSFGATQVAVIQEIMNTLTGTKLWKGGA